MPRILGGLNCYRMKMAQQYMLRMQSNSSIEELLKFSTWVVIGRVAQDSGEGHLRRHLLGGPQPRALPLQAARDIVAPSSPLPANQVRAELN